MPSRLATRLTTRELFLVPWRRRFTAWPRPDEGGRCRTKLPLSTCIAKSWARVAALVFVAFVVHGVPQSASAQTPNLVVVPGDFWGIDDGPALDIVEESAFLAEDYGGFDVFRHYHLETLINPSLADDALACLGLSDCVADILFGSRVDYVLAVSVDQADGGVYIVYQLTDIQSGTMVSEELATMAHPTDFASLVGPFNATLDRVAARQPEPTPVVIPTPPPPVVQPIQPIDDVDHWERPRRGPVGQAGMYTAMGGGAVVLGGVLMGFAADDTLREIQAEPHDRERLTELQDRGRSQQTIANVGIGLGATMIVAGVVMIIVDRPNHVDGRRAAFDIDPIGRRATLHWSF